MALPKLEAIVVAERPICHYKTIVKQFMITCQKVKDGNLRTLIVLNETEAI